MSRRAAYILLCSVALISLGVGVSFPAHDTDSWNRGTFEGTTVSSGDLVLSGENGTYEQRFDAGDQYAWDDLIVDTTLNNGEVNVTLQTSNDNFSSITRTQVYQLSGGTETFNLSSWAETRYIRFNVSLQEGTSSPRVHDTNITLADGVHFLIRPDACQDEEKELFSMSGVSNAHAAEPGYYSDYHVCSSGLDRHQVDRACTRAESPQLSFFDTDKPFVHLSTDDEQYRHKLCTGELSIGIRDECPASTKAMVSIYELPDAHIARPGVYNHQLCGAVFTNVSVMMQFHLGDNDTVYMNNTENPATGQYTNPDGWSSGFLAAENVSMVAGIVAGEHTVTTGLSYLAAGADQVFGMTQPRNGGGSFYIPFAQGDKANVENRRQMIAEGSFMDRLNPNFGLAFMNTKIVQLTLQLSNVDLVTDMTLSRGTHKLIIENLGQNADGEPQVGVNVTAR